MLSLIHNWFSFFAQSNFEADIKKAIDTLVSLLDWVSQAEKNLGSEQPMQETVKAVKQQIQEHKVWRCFFTFHIVKPT